MRHSKHLWRAILIIVFALFAYLIIRALLVPHSFGEFGYFRGDNVQEQMDKEVVFANRGACATCHDNEDKMHKAGFHKTVQCQNCHAPLSYHIYGDEVKEMPINRSPDLCLLCHKVLASRPVDFPQIDLDAHLKDAGAELKPGVCLTCHNPHGGS